MPGPPAERWDDCLAGDYQLDIPSLADAAASGERAGQLVLASLEKSSVPV